MRIRIFLLAAVAALSAGCATHRAKADRHFAKRQYVAAIWEYEKALEERPDGDAALRLAAARFQMGDAADAKSALTGAAAAGSPEARAIVASGEEAPSEADIAAAERLTRIHPRKGWGWVLYGDCLLRAAHDRKAADAYTRALDVGISGDIRANALYNLTVALLRLRRFGEARERFAEYTEGLERPLDDDGERLARVVACAPGGAG